MGPPLTTGVVEAPAMDVATLGLKKPRDKKPAAEAMYPDSIVEQDAQNTVTVRRPNGDVYNIEEPSLGKALAALIRAPVDQDIRREPAVARDLNQNASGVLGRDAPRLALSTAAAAATGGASLPAQIGAQGAAGLLSPLAEKATNELTPGGDTTTNDELYTDAGQSALVNMAAVPALKAASAGVSALARRISALGGSAKAGAETVARHLGLKPGGGPAPPANTLAQAARFNMAEDVLPPASVLADASPEAAPILAKALEDPSVARVEGLAKEATKARIGKANEPKIRPEVEAAIREGDIVGEQEAAQDVRSAISEASKKKTKLQLTPRQEQEVGLDKPSVDRAYRKVKETRLSAKAAAAKTKQEKELLGGSKYDPVKATRAKSRGAVDVQEAQRSKLASTGTPGKYSAATRKALQADGSPDALEMLDLDDFARKLSANSTTLGLSKPGKEPLDVKAARRLLPRAALALKTWGATEAPALAKRLLGGDRLTKKVLSNPEKLKELYGIMKSGLPEEELRTQLVPLLEELNQDDEP